MRRKTLTLSRPWPFEAIAMTMSSEQQKLSERLRAQLEGAASAADGGYRTPSPCGSDLRER
jgi:hypothetical protein